MDNKVLILPENTGIDEQIYNMINKLISYFNVFNKKLIYMYLQKNDIEYIIYKCFHKVSEYEIQHYNLKPVYYIHISIIYNNKNKSTAINIEIKDENNKNIVINNYNIDIYKLDINKIISFYIGTLKQLNVSLNYSSNYDF